MRGKQQSIHFAVIRQKLATVIKNLEERLKKLEVKSMCTIYNEKHSDSTVGYTSFYQYFKDNFNLRFGQRQVKCCCGCELPTNKIKNCISEAAKRNAEAYLMVHKRKARKLFSKLKSETEDNKNDETIAVIVFDFMQNLTLSKIPVQNTYIKWIHFLSTAN